eukprot:799706-Pyramimonas_sp.AAC.1
MPRLSRFASTKRIAPTSPPHPLRCRRCATPATLCEPETDSDPTHSAPPLVSRMCHARHALRDGNG